MEKFLRDWRKDAVEKNQFETAIFVGDKVLALTDSDSDAFWLAQTYFSTGNYTRAQSLLSRPDLIDRNPQCKYLYAYCHIKQGRFDDALVVLGDKNPSHLTRSTGSTRRKLEHRENDLANGTSKRGKAVARSETVRQYEENGSHDATNVRFEAAMCYLRGICYAKQNAFDRAKECYRDAVRIDVQCFEAFDQLMKNALMSPDEEWEFLESLDFDAVDAGDTSTSQQAADLTRMLYISRLSKYKGANEIVSATETLSTHYNLAANSDIRLSRAELLFTQCRFKDALSLTSKILQNDRHNISCLPVHLACLHELSEKNALFLLAHDLADHHPEEPSTWLAVGVYYLTINKLSEARRFFSKSSLMDPHFGPAWVGFAHTFAAEGEHDQAVSAYSTAARLFQGTHLPQLFLGMQHLQLQNFTLAREYLEIAYRLCATDPLLLNELGVVYYNSSLLEEAVKAFYSALQIAAQIDSDPRTWLSTRANLGHAYRRLRKFDLALETFDVVLRQGGRDVGVLTAKAIVLLELDRPWDATATLHEALSVSPQDAIATELLHRALEETSSGATGEDLEADASLDDAIDAFIGTRIHGRDMMGRSVKGAEATTAAANATASPASASHAHLSSAEARARAFFNRRLNAVDNGSDVDLDDEENLMDVTDTG